MKRISIKLKLTLWFTFIMVLFITASLSTIFFISEKQAYENSHIKLQDKVLKSLDEINYSFGKLNIDDLDIYDDGVYIAVYEENGTLIYGKLPSGFDRTIPFNTGKVHTVNQGRHTQYIFDTIYDAGRGHKVIVRGVLPSSGNETAFDEIFNLCIIMFPVFIIAAGIIGYLLARRAFNPVRKITEAANSINNGNDLTKRIDLGNGNDEIHKLASEFNSMFDRLQESFENEKRFTSDASHELRTPLAVIISQSENALSDSADETEMRSALENVLEKSKDMASLLSALLTLARADKGNIKLIKETVNLSDITEIVCSQISDQAKEKNIKVFADIEEDILIDADETMIIQLLLNICENGIKYGKKDGALDISLQSVDKNAVINVTDDGIGISPDDINNIWKRFFRVDESRNNGNGLGLPLAKYIANAHNGDITVESVPGQGSTFKIILPKIN